MKQPVLPEPSSAAVGEVLGAATFGDATLAGCGVEPAGAKAARGGRAADAIRPPLAARIALGPGQAGWRTPVQPRSMRPVMK
ncbi:hypothetical protein Ga0074812_15410 [Parafrankia irregularis]|uniref:Uncharacterized protein n=1 Tax=Parafrankia irregularis TaxID=795642 RepID=A0A0S4QZI1_9ACTN|nr:hypothetical protein Ga0074812_15410 [Parafrankia irregularis]